MTTIINTDPLSENSNLESATVLGTIPQAAARPPATAAAEDYPLGGRAALAEQRIESLPVYNELPDGHIVFTAIDDAFAPVIFAGDALAIDPEAAGNLRGEIQLIAHKGELNLWILCDAGDIDVSGLAKGRYATVPGAPARLIGPAPPRGFVSLGTVEGIVDATRREGFATEATLERAAE